jgi:putative ABC transport system permease protein
LMVVQFAVSVFFIACVLVVALQISYMKTRDLGLRTMQVVRVETSQEIWDTKFEASRGQLLGIPGVEYVAKSTVVPGMEEVDTSTRSFIYRGVEHRFVSARVSEDIFAALSVVPIEGRLFSYGHSEDKDNTAVINETAAHQLGAAGVVGTQIRFKDCPKPYEIVGVVRDFHVQGLESKVQPAFYSISNAHCGYQSGSSILIRLRSRDIPATLKAVTETWKNIEPGVPFRYTFMDDDFANLLKSYTRLQSIILLFAGISILIALGGLLALAAYMSERRTKEIGIRKILGAGLLDITGLLTRQFATLVLIGVLVGMPLAWYAMHNWLDRFAYHIPLHVWVLAASGLIAAALSLLIVGLQAWRAARANPVESLRNY